MGDKIDRDAVLRRIVLTGEQMAGASSSDVVDAIHRDVCALPAAPAEAHRITMKQDQSGVFIAHDVGADIMAQGPTELEAWERLAVQIAVETYGAPLDAAPAEDVRAGALKVMGFLEEKFWQEYGVRPENMHPDAVLRELRALIPEART